VNDDGIGVMQPVAPKSNVSSILELVQHAQADFLAFKHRLQVAYGLCQFHVTLGRARVHAGSGITVGQVLGNASHFAVLQHTSAQEEHHSGVVESTEQGKSADHGQW